MGFIWLAFISFLNTVPLAIIAFLANLASVSSLALDDNTDAKLSLVPNEDRFLGAMEHCIAEYIRIGVWRPASGSVRTVWMGLATYHAIIVKISGRHHSLSTRQGGCCQILRFSCHFSANHLYCHRCYFQ
jgi:hypothetical protein